MIYLIVCAVVGRFLFLISPSHQQAHQACFAVAGCLSTNQLQCCCSDISNNTRNGTFDQAKPRTATSAVVPARIGVLYVVSCPPVVRTHITSSTVSSLCSKWTEVDRCVFVVPQAQRAPQASQAPQAPHIKHIPQAPQAPGAAQGIPGWEEVALAGPWKIRSPPLCSS